jgi:hypothetical protein
VYGIGVLILYFFFRKKIPLNLMPVQYLYLQNLRGYEKIKTYSLTRNSRRERERGGEREREREGKKLGGDSERHYIRRGKKLYLRF